MAALFDISLIKTHEIKPTEHHSEQVARALSQKIRIAGYWTHPIFVERSELALMDGHHRLSAALELGFDLVPAVAVSYGDPGVRLEAWRPQETYTPEQILSIARTGDLLPYKTTRHVFDYPMPRCRVPLSVLHDPGRHRERIAEAGPYPSREALLTPHYHAIGRRMGIRTISAEGVDTETPASRAPHARLRQVLQADPSMAALLPSSTTHVALGGIEDTPFRLNRSGLLLLSPALVEDAGTLAATARWGLEAANVFSVGALTRRRLVSVLRHGAALLFSLPLRSQDLLLETLPRAIADELVADQGRAPSARLIDWQAGLIEGLGDTRDVSEDAGDYVLELEKHVEHLLCAGGDSRLEVDPATGFNRYGVPPRPRPEAVHFSSSTASATTDYGFMFCDLLRRDLLTAIFQDGETPATLLRRVAHGIGVSLLDLIGLGESEADVGIAPSGTDTEVLSVMLALAGGDEPLTNVLISPEETGRGVGLAAKGCFFDPISQTGMSIEKGAPVWPGRDIEVRSAALRDGSGAPRGQPRIAEELRGLCASALDRGRRVLLHGLATSKTGLSAPGAASLAELEAMAPDRIDVVIDACQMRDRIEDLAEWARRGWMVQISGSKFLTGPPFSGALVVPPELRSRVEATARLLATAPAIGRPEHWSEWWSSRLGRVEIPGTASFGPMFRWLPALLEAHLMNAVNPELARYAFERFRSALRERLAKSEYLRTFDLPAPDRTDPDTDWQSALIHDSIVSFSVEAPAPGGGLVRLDEAGHERIFRLLNLDLGDALGALNPAERAQASQMAHIGQPVTIATRDGPITVLRLVLGARYFTIVGHAGPDAIEAALESEISDALRAISKLELLAARWPRLRER